MQVLLLWQKMPLLLNMDHVLTGMKDERSELLAYFQNFNLRLYSYTKYKGSCISILSLNKPVYPVVCLCDIDFYRTNLSKTTDQPFLEVPLLKYLLNIKTTCLTVHAPIHLYTLSKSQHITYTQHIACFQISVPK